MPGEVLTLCHRGEKMYVPSNTPKYVCSHCRNKIPVGDLEAVFQEQLRSYFLSSADLARYLEEADQTIKDKKALLETLQAEERKVREEMEKVYRLHVGDRISAEGFGRS